ncbi:MAG: acetyltransferase [Bacteroidales bacterium]|jgi:sugar O-acyltransferase (sialic acid O-acetyltransferase NeuD family)
MKKIAIYGAGGFGREVEFLIQSINENKPQYEFIGYFDDVKYKGDIINSFPILGGMNELNNYQDELCLAVAVGDPVTKKKIITNIVNKKISYPTLIHPNVVIGNKDVVSIGEGCIICAGVMITVNIEIKDFVILNLGCTVGHDVVIGNYSSFMPSVNISGEVIIEDEVYVGTGAKIINQLEIGRGTIVGAGAVVAKSLPANCTAVGIPAKPIKFHNDHMDKKD